MKLILKEYNPKTKRYDEQILYKIKEISQSITGFKVTHNDGTINEVLNPINGSYRIMIGTTLFLKGDFNGNSK